VDLKAHKYVLVSTDAVVNDSAFLSAESMPAHVIHKYAGNRLNLMGASRGLVYYHLDQKAINQINDETVSFLTQKMDMMQQKIDELECDVADYQEHVRWWARNSIEIEE
jgi:hypothetical protein